MTKAKDFADYVDKLMTTDKRPRNFVNVEFSRRSAASYQMYDNPPLRLDGHKFTNLNVMQIYFPVGVEMRNCWIKAEEKPMKGISVSFSDANLSGMRIEGGLEGSRSRFSSIGFSSVNLINAGQFIENLIAQWPVQMPESNASVRVIINGNFFTCYARILFSGFNDIHHFIILKSQCFR